ncbi:phage gp6-like head-tail connector protein [Streptococcus mutans]|nr:phage gp6-like head-tail connector protein [Streptococcus mutans]MCB5028009.1 phage gp6-like head-tail connector protein [Streptococcus mutans]MCB5031982.1 phage gp6-like head-tail connector protein [Streptococcus mutans]MCB5145201.1 phage gp6-like head-tail connector protein [Streptococcus mutans]
MVTPIILAEFKARMHLEGDEDANLTRILNASIAELTRMCGNYDVATDEPFKELVFERSRYVYNDAMEYFTKNFSTEIYNLGIAKALDEMGDDNATI